MSVKIGGAHDDVVAHLQRAEPLLNRLSDKTRKKNLQGDLSTNNIPYLNINGDECG